MPNFAISKQDALPSAFIARRGKRISFGEKKALLNPGMDSTERINRFICRQPRVLKPDEIIDLPQSSTPMHLISQIARPEK